MKKNHCPSCGSIIVIDESQKSLHCENCHKQYKNPLYKPPVEEPSEVEQPAPVVAEQPVSEQPALAVESAQTETATPAATEESAQPAPDQDAIETVVPETIGESTTEQLPQAEPVAEEAENNVNHDNTVADNTDDNEKATAPVYKKKTKALTKGMLDLSITLFVFVMLTSVYSIVATVLNGTFLIASLLELFILITFSMICLIMSSLANKANASENSDYAKRMKGLMGAQIAFAVLTVLAYAWITAAALMQIIRIGIYFGAELIYYWQVMLFDVIYIVCFGLSIGILAKSCKALVICKNPVTEEEIQSAVQQDVATALVPVADAKAQPSANAVAQANVNVSVPTVRESKFTAGLGSLIGLNITNFLLIVFTLGFGIPCAICRKYRWLYKNQVIDGRRLVFEGKAGGLFGQWIKWILLSIITLGIYSLWLPVKKQKWITEHTHFAQN